MNGQLVIDDWYKPAAWGIERKTAAEIGSFDEPGLPRLSSGRVSDVWPPRAVADRVPGVDRIARLADNENWYWHTRPPHPEFRRVEAVTSPRLNAWTAEDDAVFTERWTEALDDTVDEFIAIYQSAWHIALAVTKPESNPVARFVRDLIDSGAIKTAKHKGYSTEHLLEYKYENAMDTGPFNVTVPRRSWDYPTLRTCVCCGAEHYFDVAPHHLIRTFGAPGICAPCMFGARYGEIHSNRFERSAVLGALRNFADLTNTIPSSSFREAIYTAGMTDDERGTVVALLLTIPESRVVRQVTDCHSWLKVLQAAGIVGAEGWRQSRGTICMANDGHQCRSLAEKAICDWLHRNEIDHVTEPQWPAHPELNPTGKLRADWAVGDTFIEFAGLMGDRAYSEKIGRKVELAQAVGISLIVLLPEDLPRLGSALAPVVPREARPSDRPRQSKFTIVSVVDHDFPPISEWHRLSVARKEEAAVQTRELTKGEVDTMQERVSASSEAGDKTAIKPRFVVSISDAPDENGDFEVGVLDLKGATTHSARLTREHLERKMDITLSYEDTEVGPCEVRVAIRPLADPIGTTSPPGEDDYSEYL